MVFSTMKLLALASLSAVAAQLTATDTTVLNFAYNLELLEATYYKCALTGEAYTTAQLGPGPAAPVVTGCNIVPDLAASATYGKLAAAISADELAHVKALRTTLGFAAAQSPALNISAATFNILFKTAMYGGEIPVEGETFDPYVNELNWAVGAFIFEDVGVTGACLTLVCPQFPSHCQLAVLVCMLSSSACSSHTPSLVSLLACLRTLLQQPT
jgi:Ferritin-like domain